MSHLKATIVYEYVSFLKETDPLPRLNKEHRQRVSAMQERLVPLLVCLNESDDIDLSSVDDGPFQKARLCHTILLAFGLIHRVILPNDTVEYNFATPLLEQDLSLPSSLRDTDSAEYVRRRSLRNGLNIFLVKCCKEASVLVSVQHPSVPRCPHCDKPLT